MCTARQSTSAVCQHRRQDAGLIISLAHKYHSVVQMAEPRLGSSRNPAVSSSACSHRRSIFACQRTWLGSPTWIFLSPNPASFTVIPKPRHTGFKSSPLAMDSLLALYFCSNPRWALTLHWTKSAPVTEFAFGLLSETFDCTVMGEIQPSQGFSRGDNWSTGIMAILLDRRDGFSERLDIFNIIPADILERNGKTWKGKFPRFHVGTYAKSCC